MADLIVLKSWHEVLASTLVILPLPSVFGTVTRLVCAQQQEPRVYLSSEVVDK